MFTITVIRDIKVYACVYKNTVVVKSAKWIHQRVLIALQDLIFLVPGALQEICLHMYMLREGNQNILRGVHSPHPN